MSIFSSTLLCGVFQIHVALVFEQLRVGFAMPVEQHADGPGTSERLAVLNPSLIREEIRFSARDALDNMQRVAMEISRPVEPGLRIEIGDIHDQRLALPMPARIADPEIDVDGML